MGYHKRGRRKRRNPQRKKWRMGIFTNRRNPGSRWIPLYDVWLNMKERAYSWWHRVPQGSHVSWKGGKIVGHTTGSKRPWFSKRREVKWARCLWKLF